MLLRCHDFYNGEYYQDCFTGETCSIEEYNERKREEERKRKEALLFQECQHYKLIEECEARINEGKSSFSLRHGCVYDLDIKKPEGVVIISDTEYIKSEKRNKCFYRKYQGKHELFLEVLVNKKLPIDKVQEIHGFFLCTKKGKGVLYTREQFIKEVLN